MSQQELLTSQIILHIHNAVLNRFQVSILFTFLVQRKLLEDILCAKARACTEIARSPVRCALMLLLLFCRVILSMDLACPDL